MKSTFAFVIILAASGVSAATPGPLTSSKTLGEISIVPEPKLVNGELILKVVALNESQKPAPFGPRDITISTADGKSVPLMSLDALIARVRADAGSGSGGSGSYNSSYTPGPTTTYNQYGQPDVHNFTGGSQPLGGQINPEAPTSGARSENAAVAQQITSLKAGILQDVSIAPGEVKGGEVITQRIRFHWREKHTLHIEVRFNGEQHEFDVPAPPEG
jgi:hypothetical protein